MDPNLLLTVNVPALSLAAGGLPREVVQVARLFDGHRPVGSVLDASHLSPRMTVAVVGRLRRLGILEPPEERWGEAPESVGGSLAADTRLEAAPPPAPLARALALAETLELPAPGGEPPAAPAPGVPAAPLAPVPPAPAPGAPVAALAPAPAAPAPGFEAADEQFFGSYRPEPLPDDFADLEERPGRRGPAARRAAAARPGWLGAFLGRLGALLP